MLPLPPTTSGLPTAHRLSTDPLRALDELQREHGDIYLVPVPFLRTVVVTHPDLLHQILVRDFRKYRKDFMTRQLDSVLGGGLLLSEGDPWRRHRRLAQPAFHQAAIGGYAAAMTGLTEETLAGWSTGRTMDLQHEMMRLTLRIAARTLFGHEIGADADAIGRALDAVMRVHMGVARSGILLPRWLPTPANARYRAALRDIDRVVYGMIEAHRRDLDERTLLGMLLAATDEEGGLTDRQLRDEAVTLLMAGHETTAIALTMALYLVSQHPHAEEKLHAELDAVLAEGPPGLADLARLPYTRAVILETMRLYPPAWSMGREPLDDVAVGPYTVPKGTHVWLAQWVVQRDARWFADPLVFAPERWLDGTLEKGLPDGAFVPFGLGPRTCIGKRFAELETVLVLATIARSHALRLAPGETLRLLPSVTLRPEGLSMVASQRPARRVAA